MTVLERYREKCVSAEEALAFIRPGDEIVSAFGAGEAPTILGQLHTLAGRVEGLSVWMSMSLPSYPFLIDPAYEEAFEVNSWFHGPAQRKAQSVRHISFQPGHLHNVVPRKYSVSVPRVYVGSCTPPDRHGYVKTSMSVTYERLPIETAEILLMEVNPNLPHVWGDTELHIDRVSAFVESDRPAMEIPIAPIGDKDRAIGRHIAELVHDGDTFQLGIGSIPNAVAQAFIGKKHLGVHTEMISSSMADLVQSGVIDGSRKTLHPGKLVGTFILGDRKLYDFVDNNPSVLLLRGDYVNDPAIIARNDNMVSINTGLQVDLTGQVASESIGHSIFSGSGGQNDTAEGAIHAKNGRSIIALYATAKEDTVSTITPALYPGAAVTLSRNNIDFIVTEYGIAPMRGLPVRQRVHNLVAVAHPKFREQLIFDAKANRLI